MDIKKTFPKGFLWGSATSAEQSEANSLNDFRGGKSETTWNHWFNQEKSRFFDQQFSQNDFYGKYEEDIKIAKSLNFNSLRVSISWARLIPDGKNVNEEGVNFYKKVFENMRKNNLKVLVVLHHFDLPMFAQNKGGWVNKTVADDFAFFAKKAFIIFGSDVDAWFTFNEPNVVIAGTYWKNGIYPHENNFKDGMIAMWNMIVAHHKAIAAFRTLNLQTKIGFIHAITPAIARSNHQADLKAARMSDLFEIESFLEPIINGEFPQELIKELKIHNLWPKDQILDEEIKLIKEYKIDLIGLNYYTPNRVKSLSYMPNWSNPIAPETHWFNHYDLQNKRMNPYRGWEIFPKGIYDILLMIKNKYQNIECFISENGMGVADEKKFKVNGVIQDDYRIDFHKEHIYWMHKALKENVNVIGYQMWTYIDNWSWLNAYKNRYGFIELDLKTGNRIPKKSAAWMQQLAKTNTLVITTAEKNKY
ncbi:MAG: family 1 glycosylhydrolase [Mycoplasmataceae bacterium]|nr:family 1 glycosylhydrolase [Mycoplasmataceae bacterium]